MREEYSQHIHHTTNEVQSGRACACVCTSAQAASAAAKRTRWANAGPATYVHLGKAGPGLSHNRL